MTNYRRLYDEISKPAYAGMTDAEIADALNAATTARQRVTIGDLQARAMETGVYTALRVAVASDRTPADLRAVCQTVLDLASARFADVDLDSPASVQMFDTLAQAGVVTQQQAAAIDALADVVRPSWSQSNLGADVTEADIAAARLWVDYDVLRSRLATGYNDAVALVDAGLAAGRLPAWADIVALVEAA